jgi:diguanylate cyclase (GGDEF)-like protein
MDEKSTTQFCGAITQTENEPVSVSTLPMYLIIVSGGIPGAMLRLGVGGTRLGRAADNTFQLHEISISRQHSAFRVDPQGTVWVSDLGSTNGTYLNGRRLPAQSWVRLQDGDRIQLGSVVIVKFVRLAPNDEQFQREMFERTVRDALTGLYNRVYFLDRVRPLADVGALRGLGLALMMIDIDHFKWINDTYGHAAGDVVLREVAQILRESTRSEDLVARYGGEEFVVALPVTAPDQATERAERIRTSIEGRSIVANGQTLHVTASVGLAFAPADRPRTTNALLTTADHCLYQAKNSGRNRIVFRHDYHPVLESRTSDSE